MSKVFWAFVGALVVVAFLHAGEGEAFRAVMATLLAFLCGGMARALEVSR